MYVDNYKVLKERDITLSSQFQVTRSNLNFHISRTRLKHDFFSEGLDIVALFGQNGSGKSTTIELITHILSGEFSEICEFFAFYEKDGCIYYYSNIERGCRVTSADLPVISLRLSDIRVENQSVVYFSHQVEPLANKKKFKSNKYFSYNDCSNQAKLSVLKSRSYVNNEVRLCFQLLECVKLGNYGIGDVPMVGASYPIQEVTWYLKKISNHLFNIPENKDDFSLGGNDISRSLFNLINIFQKKIPELSQYHSIVSKENLKKIFTNEMYKVIAREMINNSKRYVDLLLMLDSLLDVAKWLVDNRDHAFEKKGNVDFGGYSLQYYESHKKILEIYLDIISGWARVNSTYDLKEIIKHEGIDIDLAGFEKSNNMYEIFHLSSFIQSTFRSNNEEGRFSIENYESFEYINDFMSKDLRIFKRFELKWNGISSGQYSLLIMFARLFEACKDLNDLVVFIDEGESNLHPEWQRVYIKELVNFFEKIKQPWQKIQVVVTSHSPFVLSDLPRESINILGKRDENHKFFGANIFEIYNKGFLLERTVGQFSYEKIAGAIKKIRTSGIDEESQGIIDMIGDEIVKKLIEDIK